MLILLFEPVKNRSTLHCLRFMLPSLLHFNIPTVLSVVMNVNCPEVVAGVCVCVCGMSRGLCVTCCVVAPAQGTNVAAGKARGIVIGTGLETEIGESTAHSINSTTIMRFVILRSDVLQSIHLLKWRLLRRKFNASMHGSAYSGTLSRSTAKNNLFN